MLLFFSTDDVSYGVVGEVGVAWESRGIVRKETFHKRLRWDIMQVGYFRFRTCTSSQRVDDHLNLPGEALVIIRAG